MMHTHELVGYLDDLLEVNEFTDFAPNGLQIEGTPEINRLATAVTADLNTIEQAIEWQADALLVHHGYFWKGEAANLVSHKRQRIKALMKHDINLLAYHLPLDCHKTFGNNAQLAKRLNFTVSSTHAIDGNKNLLWQGELLKEQGVDEFTQRVHTALERAPLALSQDREKTIKRLAWCTGAAQDLLEHAIDLGVDAFLSGEVSERTYYQAKESGVHFLACGHHATERYGVQALGQHLVEAFSMDCQFIDSDNPI